MIVHGPQKGATLADAPAITNPVRSVAINGAATVLAMAAAEQGRQRPKLSGGSPLSEPG